MLYIQSWFPLSFWYCYLRFFNFFSWYFLFLQFFSLYFELYAVWKAVMGYAQLVIGPAGSGKVSCYMLLLINSNDIMGGPFSEYWAFWKFFNFYLFYAMNYIYWLYTNDYFQFSFSNQSTYCSSLYRHCETVKRSIHIVNLDPAAENFDYPVAMGKLVHLLLDSWVSLSKEFISYVSEQLSFLFLQILGNLFLWKM